MTTLRPIIKHTFKGNIWRMDIDGHTSTLLLEIRNDADKQTTFASVNLSAPKINFEDYTTDERWLTGMEVAHQGILLLHFYQSENLPVHKGVTAINAVTAETLWSNYSLAFDHMSTDGPVMFNTQILPKKLYVYDIETGKAIRAFSAQTDIETIKEITLPEHIAPDKLLISELTAAPIEGLIHYLEHNGYRIVSLHTRNNGRLQQRLYVLDSNSIVYEEILMTDIQKLQPEAFVLHKNWLICLKNKTELLVLDI